jgi:predicted O-methyltransferase YrrM
MVGLYWSTFRTQVPLYPSGPATWQAVEDLLPASGPFRLVDIGSGLGGLVLHLARQRPDSAIYGIELAPLTWLASAIRARLSRSTAQMLRGGYEQLNLADFDIVFAYLSPAAMPALWTQARAEMRPGALLLSFEFPVAGVAPDFQLTPRNDSGKQLFGWTM